MFNKFFGMFRVLENTGRWVGNFGIDFYILTWFGSIVRHF
jgi:hypothetical protein